LGYNLVGYGCTTCIGNSGPLPEPIEEAIQCHDLNVASVLSGKILHFIYPQYWLILLPKTQDGL
jgi:hypothetical protein